MKDELYYDDTTVGKVLGVLIRNGHTNAEASRIVGEMQNLGLKFREPIPEGYESEHPDHPDAELNVTVNTGPELTEWIERQQEERRAWAVTASVETLRYADQWTAETLVDMAGKLEAFVKGPEPEDPDLHDQDALDLFYVLYAEDAQAGVEFMRSHGFEDAPTEEQVVEAAEKLLDRMSKNGIRLKNGEKFERLDES